MKSFTIALSVAAVLSFFAIPDIHAEERTMNRLRLTSQAFSNNGMIPLDISLALKIGATKVQLEEAMKGHILEKAELVGLYRRR